jgi:DNA-binding response OmpR family regulator
MKQFDLLIIDDEQRYANMLARRLELRGCICQTRYTGHDGLLALEQNNFFLIVLDLRLPDLYGTEVLTRIRKICTKVPVIILTGHGTEKDRLECMEQGAYAFIHKPLDIEKLLTILADIRKTSP